MNSEADLIQTAYSQGGVISRTQAMECGIRSNEIHRRVVVGQWDNVRNGIYRVIVMDDVESCLKAARVILPRAVVSHEAAAAIHGFPGFDLDDLDEIVVTVPSYTTHRFAGIRAHRNLDLMEHHYEEIDGVWVTTPIRTLFDLAHALGARAASKLIDRLRSEGVITLDELKTILAELARRGKPGVKVIRDYITERQRSTGESPLEERTLQLLRSAGLPEPIRELPIPWDPTSRFDFAYTEYQIAIEVDGFQFHSDLEQFGKDRERDRQALKHGWWTLRFTFEDVFKRPQQVINDIKALIDRASN